MYSTQPASNGHVLGSQAGMHGPPFLPSNQICSCAWLLRCEYNLARATHWYRLVVAHLGNPRM